MKQKLDQHNLQFCYFVKSCIIQNIHPIHLDAVVF